MDWRLFNVIFLGIAFMLLFTAFQTSSMAEETVIKGARNEINSTFTGSGYTSLAVIYGVFAASNWLAPSIVAVCGAKISMVMGGIIYCIFMASFLKPMTWSLYAGSALVGFGAAVIWTAQGNFLTINSDTDTLARNSGIFWALLQCSLLFGNLYTYFAFGGQTEITHHTRTTLFTVLTSIGVAGVLMLFVLRSKVPQQYNTSVNTDSGGEDGRLSGAVAAFKSSVRLLFTRRMLLLSVMFAYTGFELSFWSGVYGTCVGATGYFGTEAKSLIGLSGIFIGVGEIFGGAMFGILGKRTNQHGRDPIILLGYITHMVALYLTYISLPDDTPLVSVSHSGTFIQPNRYVILVIAFLFGLGDSSFNTQIYSIVGHLYSEDSAPAFAIYKFIQSLACAIAFVYSDYLLLQWQLLIMVIWGTLGSFCFFIVEWSSRQSDGHGYLKIPSIEEAVYEDEAVR